MMTPACRGPCGGPALLMAQQKARQSHTAARFEPRLPRPGWGARQASPPADPRGALSARLRGVWGGLRASTPNTHGTNIRGGPVDPYVEVSNLLSVAPFEEVVGAQAWVAADYAGSEEWVLRLSDVEVGEVLSAVEGIQASGKALTLTTKEDFPLPTLGPKLAEILAEVVEGRGFSLLKGLPVGEMTRGQQVTAYWGIGCHLGRAVSQNAKGHLIGHVRDIGHDPKDPTTRIYATKAAQPYHTDSADVVCLLCLDTAMEGGSSSFTSSVSIHNAMLRARPDLVRVLAEPFLVDRKGEVPAGQKGYYPMPVFHYFGGHLTAVYARGFIQAAQRFEEVPRLTPAQLEALDMVDALAASDELRLDMWLEPGDIQVLHNHQIVHARSEFTDWPGDDGRKRHLLRLWVTPPNARPLPAAFAERYGSVDVATRGGIRCPGVEMTVPLEPC